MTKIKVSLSATQAIKFVLYSVLKLSLESFSIKFKPCLMSTIFYLQRKVGFWSNSNCRELVEAASFWIDPQPPAGFLWPILSLDWFDPRASQRLLYWFSLLCVCLFHEQPTPFETVCKRRTTAKMPPLLLGHKSSVLFHWTVSGFQSERNENLSSRLNSLKALKTKMAEVFANGRGVTYKDKFRISNNSPNFPPSQIFVLVEQDKNARSKEVFRRYGIIVEDHVLWRSTCLSSI